MWQSKLHGQDPESHFPLSVPKKDGHELSRAISALALKAFQVLQHRVSFNAQSFGQKLSQLRQSAVDGVPPYCGGQYCHSTELGFFVG